MKWHYFQERNKNGTADGAPRVGLYWTFLAFDQNGRLIKDNHCSEM